MTHGFMDRRGWMDSMVVYFMHGWELGDWESHQANHSIIFQMECQMEINACRNKTQNQKNPTAVLQLFKCSFYVRLMVV